MTKPIKFLIIHCTDTPKGRNVGSTEIKQWHLGPAKQKDGSFIYLGKKYPTLSALPPDKIGGVSISKLIGRGWKQVGYSDLIHLNGTLENLVPYNNDAQVDAWEVTNGVAGINGEARHIVYAGGRSADNKKAEDTRTKGQSEILLAYVKKMIELVPGILVAGHYQFDKKKDCPSFDVPAWLAENKIEAANIYTGAK